MAEDLRELRVSNEARHQPAALRRVARLRAKAALAAAALPEENPG
jgi:hypothetical protein